VSKGIPPASRALVKEREDNRCLRCGVPGERHQWHHRRSRSVVDPHQHCPCNGVLLCRTCHTWVHAHPLMARLAGLIVSRHVREPFLIPVITPWGERLHDCFGTYQFQSTEGEQA
jgi:hypothetical protein